MKSRYQTPSRIGVARSDRRDSLDWRAMGCASRDRVDPAGRCRLRDRALGGLASPSSDPLAAGRRAYDRGDWAAAARAARAVLKMRQDDPAACGFWPDRRSSLAATTRRSGFTPGASRPSQSRPKTTCYWG